MPAETMLAKRYARALLAVAIDQDLVTEVGEDLYGVAQAYEEVSGLRGVVGTASMSKARKKLVLERVFGGRVSKVTSAFLSLLIDKGRFGLTPVIAKAFDELDDEARGVAKGRVRSFLPLTTSQRTALRKALERFTDRETVLLEEVVEPELLGGLVVEIGAWVLDGSLRGRLRKMRDHLRVGQNQQIAEASALVAQEGAN